MKQTLPVVALGLGIPLVLLSLLWSTIFPASNSWTEEKSQRMTEVSQKARQLMYKVVQAEKYNDIKSGENAAEINEQYRAAKKELEQLQGEFENQRDKPSTIASYLRWVGIALVVVGAGANFVSRG